jgi:hypothetical protein
MLTLILIIMTMMLTYAVNVKRTKKQNTGVKDNGYTVKHFDISTERLMQNCPHLFENLTVISRPNLAWYFLFNNNRNSVLNTISRKLS